MSQNTLSQTTTAQHRASPAISVIVPVRNEAGNIAPLIAEIVRAMQGRAFEIVYVNDGSSDATEQELRGLMAEHPYLRQIRHRQSCGQSAAVRSGVAMARGSIVATLDGDGQNDPAFIPKLVAVLEAGAPRIGLVAGQRVGRKASGFKKLQSRIANGVRKAVLKDGTRDTGCGLKAFRRELFLALPYFDGQHRFLPALVRREALRNRLCRRDRPAARPRRVELWILGPALDRHSRPRRRVVADPAQKARSQCRRGDPCWLICRTR